jgi:hypothetical protein
MIDRVFSPHFPIWNGPRAKLFTRKTSRQAQPENWDGAIMPLYFFHLVSPTEHCPDDLGSDLPNTEQAYLEVYQAALDISFEMLRLRQDPSHLRFEVTNNAGEILFDLPFSEALHPKSRAASPTSLHENLRRNFNRQRELTTEIREQFKQAMSTIGATRDLLARAAAIMPARAPR